MSNIPLIRREVHHHASGQYQCTRLGGLFDVNSKRCATYTALVKVCVKVNLDEASGRWELNRTALVDTSVIPPPTTLKADDHDALAHLKDFGCFDADSKAVLYDRMNFNGILSEADLFPVNNLVVDFQVRNGKDPLLVAKQLTD